MTPKYRGLAKLHLEEARANLNTDDPVRLRSSALALRMAIEALTYERVSLYKDDMPPDHDIWQPKKLMAELLQIDPHADQSSALWIGREPSPGEQPEKMTFLGTEQVIGQETIKKHYDALGAYLHVPTIKQLAKGKDHDLNRLRERCHIILEDLEKVIDSRVWNIRLGTTASIDCFECENVIRRRFVKGQGERTVECFNCDATYSLSENKVGQVVWESQKIKVNCSAEGCGHEFYVWEKEVKRGAELACPKCKKNYRIALGMMPVL